MRAWIPFYASRADIALWSGDWRGRKAGWYYFGEGPDAKAYGPYETEADAADDAQSESEGF